MYGDVDPLVRAYSVIALGLAKRPYDQKPLMDCLTKGGDATSRPYAALALGLAARNLPPGETRLAQEFLIDQFKASRGPEMPGALALAIGLSQAEEGAELIALQVGNPKVETSLRGPACQALGLYRGDDPKHEKAFLIALNDRSDEVAQNAALGLGLRGGDESARLLVRMLAVTESPMMQAHMVTGLSHLGGPVAIEPLIEILNSPQMKRDTRMSAATALGLIIARRERDLLFELDAYTNPYGLTEASRELAQVF
jgi:HEAT repeat protein